MIEDKIISLGFSLLFLYGVFMWIWNIKLHFRIKKLENVFSEEGDK